MLARKVNGEDLARSVGGHNQLWIPGSVARTPSASRWNSRGYADDYDKRIVAVRFSLDGKEHWTEQAVENAVVGRWAYWRFSYTPHMAGTHALYVRAVNEDGIPGPLPAVVPFEVV